MRCGLWGDISTHNRKMIPNYGISNLTYEIVTLPIQYTNSLPFYGSFTIKYLYINIKFTHKFVGCIHVKIILNLNGIIT